MLYLILCLEIQELYKIHTHLLICSNYGMQSLWKNTPEQNLNLTPATYQILQQKISNILKTLELRNNNIAQHH